MQDATVGGRVKRMDSSSSRVAEPLPLPLYRHRAHRRGGRRQLWWMWAGLILLAFLYGVLFTFLPPAFLTMLLVPIFILMAIAIWALPSTNKAPTTLLAFLYYAFFISLIVWPNYLAITLPGLPWITLLRATGFPLAIVFLFCLSRGSEFRTELRASLGASPWVWKLMALFVAIQLLTIPLSSTPFSSFSKFIIAQVNWTAIFFISCYFFLAPGRVFRWTFVLLAIALYTIVLGTWEWRIGRVPWVGHIPSFLAINDDSVARILTATYRQGGVYRTQSTFTTSLSFAEYLALTTPFVIHLAVEGRRWITRAAATVFVPVIFFGIYITNSRLGALGFFLSFLLYIAIWGVRRWRSDRKSIVGPAVTLGYPAIFTSFILASLVNLRLYRMVWGGGQYEYSTDGRRQQLEMAIPIIMHNPIGHGIGQAAEVLGFVTPGGMLTIDNYYLSIALDYGVLGFIAYYGMFIAAIAYGGLTLLRSRSYETSFLLPAIIALSNFVVIKSVLSQEANHPLAFMLLGLTVALVYRVNLEQKREAPAAVTA
jgi:hypothetical protein